MKNKSSISKPINKLREDVVNAAMNKPWGDLATYLDLRFPNDKHTEVQDDLRRLEKACKALAERKKVKP